MEVALQIYNFGKKSVADKRKLFAPHLGTAIEELFLDSIDETREMSGDEGYKRK